MKTMTKKILSIFVFICLFQIVYSQQNIFYDFEEAKIFSRENDKIILIDFYTEWCGPCKVFDKEIQRDSIFSSKIFKDFIILKVNPEKDDDFGLARKYFIKSYPSFIIVNPNGYLINKQYGGLYKNDLNRSKASFLEFLAASNDFHKKGNFLKGVSNKLDLEYPQFYIDRFNGKKIEPEKIEEYWQSTNDYFSEVSFAIFNLFDTPSIIKNQYIENVDSIKNLFGEADHYNFMANLLEEQLHEALENKDSEKLDDLLIRSKNNLKEQHSILHFKYFKISLLIEKEEWESLYQIIHALYISGDFSENDVNQLVPMIEAKSNELELIKRFQNMVKNKT